MAADTTTVRPLAEFHVSMSGELLDALIEALVLPPDPRARSAVICTLIQEMCHTVECLRGSETGQGRATDQELTSLRQLARAAYDHRLRMTFVRGASGTEIS